MARTRTEKVRLGVMLVGMGLFFALAVFRLAQFQLVWSGHYQEVVDRQSGGKVPIPAERGMIYDRQGRMVAKNVTRASLYAHPQNNREMNQIATYLGKVFNMSAAEAKKQYRLKAGRFCWIKRHLDDALADRISREAPPGLHLRDETTRQYPFGQVGKQIIGFTSIDNEGLSGFELSFDSILAGKQGWADIRRDGLRNTYRVKEQALVKPVPGRPVVLTIDWHMQEIVEEELAEAVAKYNAKFGIAAFMDCKTGEILAMAHFDPNDTRPNRPVKLCAVTDLFEPGSAWKPFTAAALLDAGIVNFQDSIYCENGAWRLGRRTLHDDKKHEWLNFRRIIELSSNIGLGKWAIQLEGSQLIDAYHRFGFGRKTGCGLPGESAGILSAPSRWSDYNISAMAMGHSVAVTALQMVTAMGAIANGGDMLRPQLLLGYVEPNGYVKRVADRESLGRALEKASADSLRTFLRGVVDSGTGTPVNSKFVAIAGKTGTGEIPNLEQGGYYKHKFTASFCGFFPAERPVIAGIVVLKDPKPITYGGHTAGVAFRHIAERYTVTNPDLFAAAERTFTEQSHRLDITVETPDMLGRDIKQAKMLAEKAGVKLRCPEGEGVVVWQYPSPDRLLLADDELVVAIAPQQGEQPQMIDLRGLTIRRATAFLEYAGMPYSIDGRGRVKQQSVRPGQAINREQMCRLECRPSRS